ncbi:MAG TPA: hypothetical protein DD414_01595 [Lachnospiraceae bacterium]|nr:hypothetical protein [Lachnospiraceae bacterium]
MRHEYTKKEYEQILSMDLTESAVIRKKMQGAYKKIRAQEKSGKNMRRGRGMRRLIAGMSAVAAALVLSVTVCVANPALAAKLPLIGNIFQTVGADSGFAGNFEENAVRLVTPEEVQEDGTVVSPYVQTDNGITFTISECSYESMAMYLAVSLESEEGFSEEMRTFARYGSYEKVDESQMYVDYSTLYMSTTSTADFSASGKGIYEGDPAVGTSSPYYITGKFIDDHTFAGIIRVDLMYLGILDETGGWNMLDNEELPEEFAYMLHVTDLYADPEKEHLSGNWDFSLDVKLNRDQTTQKEMNDTNEEGIGIGTVTKTAYEVYADLTLPEGKNQEDYIVAICDAEGKPLESQAEYAEIYSTYGRDTSKLYVYVVDYITYMDECKGNNYHNLPEKAVYQTEVVF